MKGNRMTRLLLVARGAEKLKRGNKNQKVGPTCRGAAPSSLIWTAASAMALSANRSRLRKPAVRTAAPGPRGGAQTPGAEPGTAPSWCSATRCRRT